MPSNWAVAILIVGALRADAALELKLSIPDGRCIAGDACRVIYSIVNNTADTTRIHNPEPVSDHAPTVFLSSSNTKERRVRTGLEVPATPISIAPGQKLEYAVRLDEVALAPGEYSVRAILDSLGLKLSTPPVRFRVEPFQASAWTVTPAAEGAYFSWIRGGEYVERIPGADPVVRTRVPATATEPWTAVWSASTPMRWIFWRVGRMVHSVGPVVATPITIELPPGTGASIGPPLVDELNRADLFYISTGGAGPPRLVVARFCDPYKTPGEKTGVVATAPLPEKTHGIAAALDSAGRRHVIAVSYRGRKIAMHHATLSPQGRLSPFRRQEWDVGREAVVVPDTRPSIGFAADRTPQVAVTAVDLRDRRKALLVEGQLDGSAPAVRVLSLRGEPVAARVAAGQRRYSAWWLADGSVFLSDGDAIHAVGSKSTPSGPRELIVLDSGVYLVERGVSGFSLVPLRPG